MCIATPLVLAAVAAAAAVASTGIAISQSIEQAKAAEDEADFLADKARFEAIIAKRAGRIELVKNGIHARREFGRIKSQLAATGNDLGFGSTAKLTQEVVRFQAIDQALIAQNAQNRVQGLNIQIQGFLFAGKQGSAALPFKATGLALQGAASVASSFGSAFREQQRLEALNSTPTSRRSLIYADNRTAF